ncbi:MAG: hypothetical protein AAFY08_14030 [Planctomycetota bacterium]
MGPIEQLQFINAIPPAAIVDNAAPTSNVIDTAVQGGKFLVFLLQLGASDVAMAGLVVNQSDAKTDDTTLDTGTELVDWSDTKTLPSATDDDKLYAIVIDLRSAHQRYMQLVPTAGNGAAGSFISAVAFFSPIGVPDGSMGCADLLEFTPGTAS